MKLPVEASGYRVSKEYWALPLKERTFGKVREILGIKVKDTDTRRCDNYLSQLARAHEQKGLVQHRVLPDHPSLAEHANAYAPLMPEIEDKLRRRFGLRDAVVVDTSEFRPPSTAEWTAKDDDLHHEHLGRWSSRVVASLVRPDDVVATGGGRGPFYSAHFCTIPPNSTFPKRVVSLTGFISAGMWRESSDGTDDNVARDVDADHIASLLHSKLGTKEPPGLLNRSITGERPLIPKDVTIAIVGIGAIGGGHRLTRWERLNDLEPVRDHLRELMSEIANVEKHFANPFSHCVGDLCNCYFVLDAVKKLPGGESAYRKLSGIVDQINKRFVNARPEALAAICKKGAVVAIAGGPHKVGAIEHVLKQRQEGNPWITHLVTTDEVAKSLLALNQGW